MTIPIHAQNRDWLDRTEYPFTHQYINLDAGTMHYVDEGSGKVILFVHGTPTWSFLYRDFIKNFSMNYRVIAIDHIGFGLSEKPEDFEGRPQDHAHNLSEFIRKMDLKEITLVVHDFGGPVGLGAANELPERIERIVVFNTWLWETESNEEAQKIDRIINSFIGRFLYLHLNFSPRLLLKKGFSDKKKLSKKVHRQYINPFPNKNSRMGLYKIAQSLVGESDWYQLQWEKLAALEDKPWLFLWGNNDEFISPDYMGKWKRRLPEANVHTFDCGHFVQEERTEEAITLLDNFFKSE